MHRLAVFKGWRWMRWSLREKAGRVSLSMVEFGGTVCQNAFQTRRQAWLLLLVIVPIWLSLYLTTSFLWWSFGVGDSLALVSFFS
jgi:hypothetical protein